MVVDHLEPVVGRTPCAALEEELRAGPGAELLQSLIDDFVAELIHAIAAGEPRRPQLTRPLR